jgi:hypothetical protein
MGITYAHAYTSTEISHRLSHEALGYTSGFQVNRMDPDAIEIHDLEA